MPARALNCGGGNFLDNLSRHRPSEKVVACLAKNQAVAGNLHYATIEQRVVLMEDIRTLAGIFHQRKVPVPHLHDALKHDLIDDQASLAGGAIGRIAGPCSDQGTQEWVALARTRQLRRFVLRNRRSWGGFYLRLGRLCFGFRLCGRRLCFWLLWFGLGLYRSGLCFGFLWLRLFWLLLLCYFLLRLLLLCCFRLLLILYLRLLLAR